VIAWGWCSLAWVASVAFWTLVAFARERRAPVNYHEFCEVLGLCALWPFTLFLEVTLRVLNKRERARLAKHDRASRQAAS
jgi:hypothetical protein